MDKKFTKLLCFVTTAIFVSNLIAFPVAAYSDDNIRVILNEEELVFDVPPQIINDRTMVPLRVIFEALGSYVELTLQMCQLLIFSLPHLATI